MYHKISSEFHCLDVGELSITPCAYRDGKNLPADNLRIEIADDHTYAEISQEYLGKIADHISFQFLRNEVVCHREIKNISQIEQPLDEVAFVINGISFGGLPKNDFFYHNENPRIYEVMSFPIDYKRTAKDALDSNFDIQAGNRWADPGVVCDRIGRSPYQPFPAILLSNYETKTGLVHGTLNQRIFYHNYLASHRGNKIRLEIFSSFKGVQSLVLAPGRTITDDWYLGTTYQSDDIEHIFDGYTKRLRSKIAVRYGSTKINRDNMVWGSWNDGIFRDITEQMLLKEARFLKENFPTVRWIQVDDGYQSKANDAHGLGVPYEGSQGIDKTKFPQGLRHYTNAIKKIGLRPAVWIGGLCPKDTPIFQEHPEWFLDYSYRIQDSAPPDVSNNEVRNYMCHALDTFIDEWGFEAIKHDFWSYAFEDGHHLLRQEEHSGYEWRYWWLKEIRSRIPSDGYLQTGCDIAMGNPFLGEYFTNYRYGIDIGSGNWENVKINYLWGIACFATHTGDMFVPNSDAIGLFPGLNETEAMFCINYCLVTHTMVEIAGKLSQAKKSPRLPILKKAVCNPNNGQEIWFAKYDYRDQKHKTPDIIYFKTSHFCPAENQAGLPIRTIGIFNLEDRQRSISFSPSDINLPPGNYLMTDVWTGEKIPFTKEISFDVTAHGSRLLAVSDTNGLQLLDADVRILSSIRTASTIELETDYEADAKLVFNREIRKFFFNGQAIKAKIQGNTVNLHIPEKGILSCSAD